MDGLKATEAASAAVVKEPELRVKLADIEAAIALEAFMVGDDLMGEFYTGTKDLMDEPVMDELACLTICLMTFSNGFTVIGKAAPASKLNYDPELGRKFAREDAIRQAWPLFGFALRDKLLSQPVP